MFVYGRGDYIQALNAATGDLLWEYAYNMPPGPPWPGAAGTYRRNFAINGDRLFFPTGDSHEIALDIRSGKVIRDHPLADINLRYRASSGPLAVRGKLIQGMTNCSRWQLGGCVIIALDANTGNQVWRFNTIPRPGEPGDNTWNGLPLEKRQGSSVWTTASYDPDLNLTYFATCPPQKLHPRLPD